MNKTLLKDDFYLKNDVVNIARNLLGKFLLTKIDNHLTGGMIVETEAYKGAEDKACHAYMGKKTKRNKMMYAKGGCAYIYLCYGMHSLLNVVTNKKDIPDAVLIRAIEPIIGIKTMLKRRGKTKPERSLTAGPGALTKALGIDINLNGESFSSNILWIENRNINIKKEEIICSKRVGIDYAKEHKDLPFRFKIKQSKWTSLAK